MLQSPYTASLYASLGTYLNDLLESGVEGLPADEVRYSRQDIDSSPAPEENTYPLHTSETNETVDVMRTETLDAIRKSLGDCQRCLLAKTRKNLVFGIGNSRARLVFVGEGPGADEDAKGEPFVGAAGQVLNRMITNMGLKREEVYICNVVKCRPPGNRDPEENEISACSPFLLRQLKSIGPEVIVTLGKPAAQTLLGCKDSISKLRGKFRDFHGVPLMPTYHPSYLLRKQGEGSTEAFWQVWEDLVQVLRMLKLPVPDKLRKK